MSNPGSGVWPKARCPPYLSDDLTFDQYHYDESIRSDRFKISLDADSQRDDSATMIAQPYHLYVERIDATRNMARFYALSIQPTLLGQPSLLRCWGRIGSRGHQMVHMFACEEEAVELFLELLSKKRKKGYRPRTICGNPMVSARPPVATQ